MKALSYALAAIAGAAAVVIWLAVAPMGGRQDALSTGQTKQVEAVFEAYLDAHPELVAKAIETLQERQKAAAAAEQHSAIKAKTDDLFRDANDPVLGDPQGDVTIVEFFDYRCPYCKRVAPSLMETVREDGHVRLVLKEFPILGPNSVVAAHAALAARKQNKYESFHTAMLAAKNELDQDAIFALASAQGIDTKRLAEDMKDPAVDALIKKNYQLAEMLKIEGTPAFVIGDRLVPGAVDKPTLQRLIQDARKKS